MKNRCQLRHAIAEFLPLVEANSEEFQVWICLIHAYCTVNDSKNASIWAEKAEKKFGENAMLHIYMGDIFRALKQYDKAFSHWKRAQQLEPTWMDSAYSIADCYEELGDYENAYAAWQTIADDLSARGYDVEANWPRSNAARCQMKLTKAQVLTIICTQYERKRRKGQSSLGRFQIFKSVSSFVVLLVWSSDA